MLSARCEKFLYIFEPFGAILSSLKEGHNSKRLSSMNNDPVGSRNSVYHLYGLISTYSVSKFYFINYREGIMKFRILTNNQRRRERVFDAAVLLLIMGIILIPIKASQDCLFFGSIGLGWACLSWVLQRKWVPDKLWVHITSAVLLVILLFVSGSIILWRVPG